MIKIFKKIIRSIAIIFTVLTLTFFLINILPNNLADDNDLDELVKVELIKQYHLDKPIHERYRIYLSNLVKGDFGTSMRYSSRKVSDVIKSNFPTSLELGIRTIIFSILVGFPLGIYCSINEKKSKIIFFLISILIAIPSFVLIGILQSYVVYVHNAFLSKVGLSSLRLSIIGFDNEVKKILPVISLSIFNICIIIKIVSRKIKEELKKEYVQFALNKGLDINYVITKHILKNILPSVIAVLTPYAISIITGSFIIESLYGIPGLGRYYTSSIIERDYTMLMGLTFFYTLVVIILISLMDILISLLDKKISGDSYEK